MKKFIAFIITFLFFGFVLAPFSHAGWENMACMGLFLKEEYRPTYEARLRMCIEEQNLFDSEALVIADMARENIIPESAEIRNVTPHSEIDIPDFTIKNSFIYKGRLFIHTTRNLTNKEIRQIQNFTVVDPNPEHHTSKRGILECAGFHLGMREELKTSVVVLKKRHVMIISGNLGGHHFLGSYFLKSIDERQYGYNVYLKGFDVEINRLKL